jgi:hypothetical protein
MAGLRRLFLLGCLLLSLPVEGVRYRLGGFRCPSKSLTSPVIIKDDSGRVDNFCEDLAVELDDGGEEAAGEEKDPAASICVEASHSPLPGQTAATELRCAKLPVKDMQRNFNQALWSMATVCPKCKGRCGTYYLIASLKNSSGSALWFDSLTLRKECTDKPGLSLSVAARSQTVVNGLRQGSKNPFSIIGIDTVTIRNEVKNCTKGKGSAGGCGEQTDLAARWSADTPEVLAFFVPLSPQEASGKGNSSCSAFNHPYFLSDMFLASMGFTNKSGSWFFKNPKAMRKMAQEGMKDLTMFEKTLFLHKENLVTMGGQGTPGDTSFSVGKIKQDVGTVDLTKTALPLGAPYDGLLVIALDPLEKINDEDRTDNIFVQYVNVNATTESGEWVDNPVCQAEGVGLGE